MLQRVLQSVFGSAAALAFSMWEGKMMMGSGHALLENALLNSMIPFLRSLERSNLFCDQFARQLLTKKN